MMTSEETKKLLAYVHAVCPQQQIDNYTPDAWRDVLDGFSFEECAAAAREQAQKSQWIAPCDIIRIVELKRYLAEPE